MVQKGIENKEIRNEEIRKIGNCFHCGKEIYNNMTYVFGSGLFCSVKCSIEYLTNRENEEIRKVGECFNCGKEIYSNMGYVYGTDDLFCSVKCEFDYLRKNKKI